MALSEESLWVIWTASWCLRSWELIWAMMESASQMTRGEDMSAALIPKIFIHVGGSVLGTFEAIFLTDLVYFEEDGCGIGLVLVELLDAGFENAPDHLSFAGLMGFGQRDDVLVSLVWNIKIGFEHR